ncbi:MAG: type 1 glutamine amidotransferase [Pseudomonadota bacterium]
MKIGILQCGHVAPEVAAEHGGYFDLYPQMMEGHGFTFEGWSVVDMEFPASPEDADGWLVSGSKHGAYEDHPFIAPLEEFIRQIMAADKPLIGVCFGHQIIAQALGGKVEKWQGGWAIGAHMYDFPGESLMMNAWHQDQVTQKPEDADVIAANPFCANAALVYPGKAFTVQPHPEFESPFVEGLMEHRGKGVVPDELLRIAREHLGDANDNTRMAEIFARFFRTRSLS